MVVMLWHTMDGIYIWEFITSLDYEWSVIRGRRPYRRTICLYSLTRVATLITVILNIVDLDIAPPSDCQAPITFQLIFAFLATASASFLIVLRIIAIWNRNTVVVSISLIVWGTNVAFLIQGKYFLSLR